MNLQPVRDLLNAKDKLTQGKEKESLEALRRAVGAVKPTPVLQDNLRAFLEDPTLSDVAIKLTLAKTRKK